MEKIIQDKDFYTTPELAKVLGISRISVFKRVRQGSIKGQKIGRDFIVFKKDINLDRIKKIIKHN